MGEVGPRIVQPPPYADQIGRLRYKPGVTFTCVDGVFRLHVDGQSSRGTNHWRPFSVSRPIPDGLDDEGFRDWVVKLIVWWELHELFEWLRFDDVLVWEPHDTLGNAIGQAG